MARIVEIGGRRWLAGMVWCGFEDAPRKSELREDASRLNASWTCVCKGESVNLAGFSPAIDNVKRPKKLYSLAAMLANSHEQPWYGVFKIEEGVWWYLAVRDKQAILPRGDVIGGEAEIEAAKARHAKYTDWNVIKGDITTLEDLIQGIDAKPDAVRALASAISPGIAVVTMAIIVGALVGYHMWGEFQKRRALELAREAAIARQHELQELARKRSPLVTKPLPNDWLYACGDTILGLPLSKGGWALDKVSCVEDRVVVYWLRKEGASVAERPDGDLAPQGDSVDQVIPLVGLGAQNIDNSIDLASAKSALRAWAQAADFDLAMNRVVQAPPPPGAEAVPVQHQQEAVRLAIPISPFDLNLSAIPGLRLTSLKAIDKGWILEGVLYGH